VLPGRDCDGVAVGEWAFRDLLLGKGSSEELLRRLAGSAPLRLSRQDLDSERISGDSAEAARWVRDSALSPEDKDNLTAFIARFPSLTFFKMPPELVARRYPPSGALSLPPWLREVLSVLAGVCPGSDVSWSFDPSASASARAAWYDFSMAREDADWCERIRESASVRPIAERGDRSSLAVAFSDDDRAIYEFHQPDLEEFRQGVSPTEALDQRFTSYTSMLRHVAAILIDQEILIRPSR
jgi:hypothetical protein